MISAPFEVVDIFSD